MSGCSQISPSIPAAGASASYRRFCRRRDTRRRRGYLHLPGAAALPTACGLIAASFPAPALAQSSIYPYGGSQYFQNFDSLPNSGTNAITSPSNVVDLTDPLFGLSSTMYGWYIARQPGGSGNNTIFRVADGSINAGAAYSFGSTGSSDRALGSIASATIIPAFGAMFVNNTGQTLTQFTLNYTGEQWRIGNGAPNTLSFEYNIGGTSILSSGFTAAASLNFTAPNAASAALQNVALDGNAQSNRAIIHATVYNIAWQPGQTFVIRWLDANDTGNDDGLGIDDLTFAAAPFTGHNLVWTPSVSNLWNTNVDANWSENNVPGFTFSSGDNVTFTDVGVGQVVIDPAGVSPAIVTVNNNAGTYNFTGGPILGGAVLIKNGTGTLVLNNANSYAGGTFLNGGVIVTGADANLGAPLGGLTFDGGTLQLTAAINSARPVVFNGGGGVIDTGGFNSTFSGQFSGNAGTFTKSGAGNLTLTGAFNFGGTTRVTAGSLVFGQTTGSINFLAPQAGTGFTGNLVVANSIRLAINGGVIDGAGAGSLQLQTSDATIAALVAGNVTTINNPIQLNTLNNPGTFTAHIGANAGATLIVNSAIVGAANLDIASASNGGGAGLVVLAGANNYAGNTTINNGLAGVVRLGMPNALPAKTGVTFGTTVSAGPGTLDINGFDQTIGFLATGTNVGTNAVNARVTNNGPVASTLTVSGTTSSTFGGVLADGVGGPLALTKAGAGTLTLTGNSANTYTGPTLVQSSGSLILAKPAGTFSIGGNLTISTAGSVTLNTSGQIAPSSVVSLSTGGTLNLNNQSDTVFSFDNFSGILKTGSETFIVTSPNSTRFDGGTNTIDPGGTLNAAHLIVTDGVNTVRNNASITNLSAGLDFTGILNPTILLESDAAVPGTILLGGPVTTIGSGTAQLLSTGVAALPGRLDLAGGSRTFSIDQGLNLKLTAQVQNGSIVKLGGGALILAMPSTTHGGVDIQQGAVEFDSAAALGDGAITFSGGQLNLHIDAPGPGGTVTIANALGSAPANSIAIDAQPISQAMVGTMQFPSLTLGTALSATGAVGETLAVSGTSLLQASLAVHNDIGITLAGAVSGGVARSLSKDGAGTLTLTGGSANSFGSTTVYAGTVALAKTPGVFAIPGDLAIYGPAVVRSLASDQIAHGANVTLVPSIGLPTLDLSGQSATISSLNGSGTIALGAGGSLTILRFGTSPASSFSGTVTGSAMSLDVGGATNTLTLTGSLSGTGTLTKGPLAGTLLLARGGTVALAGLTVAGGTVNTSTTTTLNIAGSLTISAGANVSFLPSGTNAAGRLTHQANALSLGGSGATRGNLDVGDHELLLGAGANPATIKSYLQSAFDPSGNADWARRGLTSSIARANPTSYSVGYAYGGDTSAQDAAVTTHGGTALSGNQTVIRAVLAGDADMNGKVDFFDLSQILGYKYNTGQPASYTDGDLDYSGTVDFFDISTVLSANYNSGQMFGRANSTPTLSGAAHPGGMTISAVTTIGVAGDGNPDFEYDPSTGHLRFRTDGGAFTTTGGSASFVSSLTIASAGGSLLPGGASATFAGGTGATLTSTLLSSALTNSPGFTDGFDIGIVLAPGLGAATLTADLTVKYQSLNGGSLRTADVIFIPEPAGLAMILSAASQLVRRKRKSAITRS
jgi:autotransporter-associated beta strand protein